MTLARGDWFYILLVALDSFFMARPYLYAIQNDNYRISEIFKNKRLRFVYALDIITVAIFTGIWLTFWFLNAKAFWGFLIALFFFIAEFAMYFMEDLPDRKKPLKYTKRAVRCLVFDTCVSTAAVVDKRVVNVKQNAFVAQRGQLFIVDGKYAGNMGRGVPTLKHAGPPYSRRRC